MSLHVLHHECGHLDESHGRATFWTAWCDCGWQGERFFDRESSEAANKARREYAQHINETMGAEGFYTAAVACRNCGSRHEQGVLVGTPVYSATCSNCGQRMVKPDNEIWNEETRERSRWPLW
jgi:ribosomal protein S27E